MTLEKALSNGQKMADRFPKYEWWIHEWCGDWSVSSEWSFSNYRPRGGTNHRRIEPTRPELACGMKRAETLSGGALEK